MFSLTHNLRYLDKKTERIDTKEKVQRFLSDNDYEIPVLMSDNKIQGAYKVRGYPSKYIITPEGKLISTEFGFDWQTLVSQLANL